MDDVLTATREFIRAIVHGAPSYSWEVEQDRASIFSNCTSFTVLPVGDYVDDKVEAWRHRLEAFELLALVRHVDSAAWTTLMGKLNYIDHIRVMPKTTLLPPFNIAFEETDSIKYIDTVMSLVLTPIQDRVYDQAFLDLKQRILSMTDDPDVLATVSDIRIFAKLHDSDDRFEVTERIHHWLAVAAERGNRSLVLLIGVDINPRRLLTTTTIEKLHRHVTAGVPLVFAEFGVRENHPRFPSPPPSRAELGAFMTDLVGPHGPPQINCIHLSHRATREAMMSALMRPDGAPRLHEFQLRNIGRNDSATQRCSNLLWILMGLFSQEARHAIQKLRFPIFSGVQEHELVWLAELLRTQAAPRLELLLPDAFEEYVTAEPPVSDRWVTVPRGHLIRVDERDDWRDHALRFDDRDVRCRVLRDDPALEFIDILVPSYGHCSVARGEGITIEERPVTPWLFDQHTIRLLEIDVLEFGAEEQRAIGAFLGLVGAPVQTLCIYRMWQVDDEPHPLNAELLESIAQHCPHLDRLALHGVAPVNATAILRVFEQETTAIFGLVFESKPFADRAETLRFLEALSNPTLPVNAKLRELAINLDQYETDGADAGDLVEALLCVLETNETLEVVHVGLSVGQVAQYGEQFRAHRKRFISKVKHPVTMRAKAAALSGLGRVTDLEKCVFSRVFEFAAECDTRIVTFRPLLDEPYVPSRR